MMIAHLEWIKHRWQIKPVGKVGLNAYLTDSTHLRPLRFKTIESARARLDAEGYELGEVR